MVSCFCLISQRFSTIEPTNKTILLSRRKMPKLARLKILPNVLESPVNMPGKWNRAFFKIDAPLVLEIGCGKGEYTLALARKNPQKNHLGIDAKGDRLWRGADTAYRESIHNAGFLRIRAEKLEEYFSPGEISEIWLTFPDPYPKPSKANIRLMSPEFINLYRKIIRDDGILHLKTDNSDLFDYALEVFEEENCPVLSCFRDVHNSHDVSPLLKQVLTTFEKRFMQQGIPIKYVQVRL